MITSALQPRLHEDYAWLLGDGVDWSALSPAARRLQETRIAAAVFKRRWPLLVRWRQQSLARCRERTRARRTAVHSSPARRLRATGDGDIPITTDLPRLLPVIRDEMAILRAFLSREIDHILFGDE